MYEKRVWFEVELQGAQGDREAEVFQVSNDDTIVAQRRLEDKQPKEKTNTDCLVKEKKKEYQTGWKTKTGNVLNSCNQSLGPVQGSLGRGYNHVYISSEQGMLEPVKVKMHILGTVKGAALRMGTIQYREDSNEAAFAVAAVEKIYAHDPLTYNKTVAYEKCSDDSDGYYWSIHQLEGSLSRDCDVEQESKSGHYSMQLKPGESDLFAQLTKHLQMWYVGSKFDHGKQTNDYRNFVILTSAM
ncbi:hypothetical protein Tco_0948465 [Tanacetum coccineum]